MGGAEQAVHITLSCWHLQQFHWRVWLIDEEEHTSKMISISTSFEDFISILTFWCTYATLPSNLYTGSPLIAMETKNRGSVCSYSAPLCVCLRACARVIIVNPTNSILTLSRTKITLNLHLWTSRIQVEAKLHSAQVLSLNPPSQQYCD